MALIARLEMIRQHFARDGYHCLDCPNRDGYQIGDMVIVKWDKENYHPFKPGGKRWRSSRLENKYGVVIGTTATMVDLVIG